MDIELALPIRPHLKQYIEKQFGKEIKLTEMHWFGLLILNILKKKKFQNPNYKFKYFEDGFKESIHLKLHIDKTFRYGIHLLPHHTYYINKCISYIFLNEVIHHAIINKKNYEIDYKISILNILDYYEIREEHISYETIRRDFNRKIHKKNWQ